MAHARHLLGIEPGRILLHRPLCLQGCFHSARTERSQLSKLHVSRSDCEPVHIEQPNNSAVELCRELRQQLSHRSRTLSGQKTPPHRLPSNPLLPRKSSPHPTTIRLLSSLPPHAGANANAVQHIMWNLGKLQVFPAGDPSPCRSRDAGVRMDSLIVYLEPY